MSRPALKLDPEVTAGGYTPEEENRMGRKLSKLFRILDGWDRHSKGGCTDSCEFCPHLLH